MPNTANIGTKPVQVKFASQPFKATALVVLISFAQHVHAVDCSEPDITLTSQAAVDNFQDTYGGGGICDTVGTLTLTGTDINSLDPLSDLVGIGSLTVDGTGLVSLNGLQNLSSASLNIKDNLYLEDITALSKLTGGRYLWIWNNPSLTSLSGLENFEGTGRGSVEVFNNFSLESLEGLSSLRSVGNYLKIANNDNLQNLEGLSSLEFVGWYIQIVGNENLQSLNGLLALSEIGDDSTNSNKYLFVSGNPSLVDLNTGVSVLKTTGLYLENNESLESLNGLPSIFIKTSSSTSSGGLRIQNNASLKNLDGLSFAGSLDLNNVIIRGNPNLENIDALSAMIYVSYELSISDNQSLQNIDGLSGITGSPNFTKITNNAALRNLDGLSNFSAAKLLWIEDNPSLTNLDGLTSLVSVSRMFSIDNNDALVDVSGLQDFTYVVEDFTLSNNDSLNACWPLRKLLDDADDDVPGPGPGPGNIPDIGGDVFVVGNGSNCSSLSTILDTVFFDGFEDAESCGEC